MNDTSNSVKQRKTRYDLNFKRSAVELWQSCGKSAAAVAAELGISDQTLKVWKQQLCLLLMRRDNVDANRLPQLPAALKHNESFNTGYLLKEALGLLWEQPSYPQMKSYLHQWCAWARESGVRQRQQLGKTLLGHARGILAWWQHRISNGRMEGINNKIKTLLRQTYGLRRRALLHPQTVCSPSFKTHTSRMNRIFFIIYIQARETSARGQSLPVLYFTPCRSGLCCVILWL